jgi:hypothetical protein
MFPQLQELCHAARAPSAPSVFIAHVYLQVDAEARGGHNGCDVNLIDIVIYLFIGVPVQTFVLQSIARNANAQNAKLP